MRDQERAKGIVGDDAAGVANDVRVAGLKTKGAYREASVHAGEDGELALGARSETAEFVGTRVLFVGDEDFVDDGHGGEQSSV